MKGAAIVALALVGGGLLAHLLLADPGYVAIRIGRSLFETTLPVFVLLLVGGYLVAGGVSRAFASRRRIAQLRAERRRRRARDDTRRGLIELAAGQWKSAEDLLSRAAPDADSPAAKLPGRGPRGGPARRDRSSRRVAVPGRKRMRRKRARLRW